MGDIRMSTGLKQAILSESDVGDHKLVSNTVSFTTSQILDTGNLASFLPGDIVKVHLGLNDHVVAQVISGDANQLTFYADSFTIEASGSYRMIEKLVSSGSLSKSLSNGVIGLFSSPRPIDADASEGTAVLLALLTRGGASFAAGVSVNGLNTKLNGTILDRAIDPNTGSQEIWTGLGLTDGTVTWGRYYDNSYTTGSSTTAKRFDGDAGDTSGFNFYMQNGRSVAVGGPVTVDSINLSIYGKK
jgi:hypothetical protein